MRHLLPLACSVLVFGFYVNGFVQERDVGQIERGENFLFAGAGNAAAATAEKGRAVLQAKHDRDGDAATAPPVYVGDQTQGDGVVRTLTEQVALETRTRMLNPKWYEDMLEHGYEGVRQIEVRAFEKVQDAVKAAAKRQEQGRIELSSGGRGKVAIVYAEGEEERVLRACQIVVDDGLARRLVQFGIDRLRAHLEAVGLVHLHRRAEDDPAILETWL